MNKKVALVIGLALLSVSALAAGTQPVVVHTFACTGNVALRIGKCPDGGTPDSIVQGSDGNFYGTAQVSMEGNSEPNGGSVFSLTPTGTIKVLHTFAAGPNKNYPNGNLPGLLTEGPDGKLYGEALFGGLGGCNGYCGSGVLFRVNRDGSGFQVIHEYCSAANCADGVGGGALFAGTDGNLYGTTFSGGANGVGTIFRVTVATGKYEVVFDFSVSLSGADPSNLVVAKDGTFWGLSSGSQNELLFHYTEATGEVQTFPVNFPLINGLPSRGGMLTLGANGNFFGLYHVYGESGMGMFEVDPDGTNLQLFPFYTTQEGAGAPLQMLLGTDGNFYLTDYNGKSGYGDITELSPTTGQIVRVLAPFGPNAAVGAYPSEIMQASDGTFWGVTGQYGKVSSGQFADGTVFRANLGLPPR